MLKTSGLLYFTNKIQVSQIHLFVYNILLNIFIKIEMKFTNIPKMMLNFCPQIMNIKNNISDFYSNPHFSKQLHIHESSASTPPSTSFHYRIRIWGERNPSSQPIEIRLRAKEFIITPLRESSTMWLFLKLMTPQDILIFWTALVVIKFFLYGMKTKECNGY